MTLDITDLVLGTLYTVLNLFAFCLFVVADVDFVEYDLLFGKLLCLFSLFFFCISLY